MQRTVFLFAAIILFAAACNRPQTREVNTVDSIQKSNPYYSKSDTGKLTISNENWNKVLPKDVYAVAREKGTERAFTGKYNLNKDAGAYYCAVCGNALFSSNGKFESSCGWPSFFEPISKHSIIYAPDNTHGMKRTEVMCGRCNSHLGHVFNDGPPPTGLRYCINSVILDFTRAKATERHYADSAGG